MNKRLTPEQISRIISMRKSGISTRKIAVAVNLPRERVLYHCIKHCGRKMKIVDIDASKIEKNDEHLGEFLGIFCADGHYYKSQHKYVTRISLSQDETEYAETLVNLFRKIFGKKPIILTDRTRHIITLKYHSKKLMFLFEKYLSWEGKKTYTIKLKSMNHSKDFYRAFVRGFLDCDGYKSKHNRITLFCVSKRIMLQIRKMIISIGFHPEFQKYVDKRGNRKPLYFVIIRAEDGIRFLKYIKPRNPKRRFSGSGEIRTPVRSSI